MLKTANNSAPSRKAAVKPTKPNRKITTKSTKRVAAPSSQSKRASSSLPAFEPYDGPTPTIMPTLRQKHSKQIEALSETIQAKKYTDWLDAQAAENTAVCSDAMETLQNADLNGNDAVDILRAGMMTFLTHVESRASSSTNQGFYTIGPCGEELLGTLGLNFRDHDGVALHYRHLAVQILRQLRSGRDVDQILLDRARGHTVSTKDPVTGGVHCALGGGDHDFLVTSTLASQATPAVGRAIGASMTQWIKKTAQPNIPIMFPPDSINFVSLGDGSVNNGHFLSAVNLAEYAKFRKFSCPIVFCITDNDISISLRGFGYLQKKYLNKLQMPVFKADGKDALSILQQSKLACDTARKNQEPVCLYIGNLTRRFGHAATDRQSAYLSTAEIAQRSETNPLESFSTLLHKSGTLSYKEQSHMFTDLWNRTKAAFDMAVEEPKNMSREQMLQRAVVPLAYLPGNTIMADKATEAVQDAVQADPYAGIPTPSHHTHEELSARYNGDAFVHKVSNRKDLNNIQTRVKSALHTPLDLQGDAALVPKGKDVMRKHMTKVFNELMAQYPQMVYMGEDVTHGGYYLVSEGLSQQFPGRVRDFAPDETALLGAAMGFAQNGLLPICEIPYIKYLDCAMDIMTEAGIMSWLSNQKQPNGMILRLQGYGKGVFGGNYHTTNVIYTLPGFDVLCWSNGRDYARGMRYAVHQAQHGRVVMTVDSTTLLNQRHVNGVDDDGWRKPFTASNEMLDFEQVIVYPADRTAQSSTKKKQMAIVTYGEGVPLSLQTSQEVMKKVAGFEIDVIDTPLLNRVPIGLKEVISKYNAVLFVDPSKDGLQPLANHAAILQREQLLPPKWSNIAALPTYNPLGSTITFVNSEDILNEIEKLNPQWKL